MTPNASNYDVIPNVKWCNIQRNIQYQAYVFATLYLTQNDAIFNAIYDAKASLFMMLYPT